MAAAVVGAGRRHRRVADLLIAAIALALYTRNPADFIGLEDLITVTTI